ncbi:MAG: zinc-finger domain-containing protein [Candidatus Thiodiazotropha sp. (ex Lucina aurantia)]|uniref:Zinc-finger domain protein n=2 Tax=Candidatus Thiodiazotropha TaxID=1913444 RepID=A0A7Z0VMH8_9GAMM|nr:zinc-finger domain-containing protein [Candidatus Thiodiazotropha endolucinida]MBT3013155.1 zinc-finger domain-containing protein [Candidatus Thiodiazotropha sp. (ex Lucina pensylvanica)]MBT3017097.1 zinc-finger domain-containing protein [Candidatus Thiodiazotropha taylori]MBT3040651.1 zinc-finger domain-containing protein [Candidatus Thiodiazotropha sp. (ex Codakia orbicularis)]MBV2104562.1 zinc-finger domain-containing protein [Candidatus Thiodiazotropha sp. (ex Lucina aurantia)]MBW926467
MTQTETQATQQDAQKVTRNDLPLSCPRPGEALAGLHPRVYLPIEKTGSAVCPYCGTRYQLSD